jgi:hypothetical protein
MSMITDGYIYAAYGGIAAGAITNLRHFYAYLPTKTSDIDISNRGLYLEDITLGSTLNFAIYMNACINSFGDHIKIRTDK